MSRKKKIGLGIVAVLFVVGAAGAASPEQPAPAVAEQTISATATATALPKPSPATPSPTVAPTPAPTPLVGIVTKVVDGDTIRVDLPTGVETVRIIGIDTPETVDHNRPEACFGAEASAFARASLEGKSVTLEIDPTQDDHDRYDRLLAHIHVGDVLYAAEAIGRREGGQRRDLGHVSGSSRPAALGAGYADAEADRECHSKARGASANQEAGAQAGPRLPPVLRSLPADRRRPRLSRDRTSGERHRPRRLPPGSGSRRHRLRQLLTPSGPFVSADRGPARCLRVIALRGAGTYSLTGERP
jgi:endonuclease YncB( thermonuclease family)